jgi:hypothetical protein
MQTRFKEHHKRTLSKVDGHTDEYESAVGQHARVTNHHFRPEDVTCLDRESNKRARGIKEAIYERALKPDLNKDGGLRYILPTTYDTLLSKTIKPPKPPTPSAPGSPPPTYDINADVPKGRQPGAKNIPKCLPRVDAAIANAARPPAPPPPPSATTTHRDHPCSHARPRPPPKEDRIQQQRTHPPCTQPDYLNDPRPPDDDAGPSPPRR